MSQSSLGTLFEVPQGGTGRTTLRTGRVAAPFHPVQQPEAFNAYIKRCLRAWSVDVQLDSGDYIPSCRIVSPQSNGREGIRRMFRVPTITTSGTVLFGDLVVVGFINGQSNSPVVLGALSPKADPDATDDAVESSQLSTSDPSEWIDRHDHVNLDDPTDPLRSSTVTRDTGLTREMEHQSAVRVDGVVRQAHIFDRDLDARSTQHEHLVERSATDTSIVRDGNTEATDLRHLHVVQSSSGTNVVSTEDLAAQVLQLTQQVGALAKLVLRSDGASTLLVQQDTEGYRLTGVSDAPTKTLSLLHEDVAAGTHGGVTFGPESEVVLRRGGTGAPEAYVRLGADGSVTCRSAGGAAVRVSSDDVLVTSTTTTVRVSESNGVSVTTKGGTLLSIEDDAVVVSSPACTVQTETLHLASGAVRVGSGAGGDSGVPSVETLYQKLGQVETALVALFQWAKVHVHTATGPSSPTTPPTTPVGAEMPAGLFSPATAKTDALQTFRGE